MEGTISPVVKKNAHHLFWIWVNTILFSFLIFFLVQLYILLLTNHITATEVNQTAGVTAFLLIGISFSISSISYFLKATSPVPYRKYIGLSGFGFAIAHFLLSISQHKFPEFFLKNHNGLPFYFGLTALIIITIMALISNAPAMKLLGGTLWRRILRVGYLAFILGLIHFLYSTMSTLTNWITNPLAMLPPVSFLLIIFGFLVIFLRLFLQVSLSTK